MGTKIDIVATLKAMDAVDEFRRHDEAVDHEYDLRASQPRFMEQLRGTYSSQGLTVTDDALQKGIELYYAGRLTYTPVPLWKRALSALILHRLMVAAVIVIAVGATGAISSAVAVYQHEEQVWQRQAVAAEKKRLDDAATASSMALQQQDLKGKGLAGKIDALEEKMRAYAGASDPEAQYLVKNIEQGVIQARAALTTVPAMLKGFTPYNITPTNYQQADKAIAEADSQLSAASAGIDEANSAIGHFNEAKVDEAQAQRALAAAAEVHPGDATTKSALDETVSMVRGAVVQGNTANMTEATTQLSSLTDFIQQHLRINIVNADGVRSGVWRYSVSNPNIKNYYIVVQAVDDAGKVVPMSIRNEENGATSTVNYWGERVPEAIYDQVRDDKVSHGFVTNVVFAEKPAGSMNIAYSRIPKSEGAITNW